MIPRISVIVPLYNKARYVRRVRKSDLSYVHSRRRGIQG